MTGTVQVRRPRAIVFDILGTATKSGFLERILFPYLKVNLEPYINTHWDKSDFLKLYKRIQDQSQEFQRQEPTTPLVSGHNLTDAKQTLINFINFVTENNVNSPAVTQLRFKVWFEGYQSSRLRTPIYKDVPESLKRWFAEGIKFHVFSNTWVEAQKALLRNTNHGDLTNLITGYFDNDFGLLTEPDSWRRFCTQIHEDPNNVLFLTKSVQEGHAAQEAGVQVVLVLTHRHNVKAVTHEDRQRFPYLRTLLDLQWLEGSMMPGGGAAAAGGGTNLSMNTQNTTGVGSSMPAMPTGTSGLSSNAPSSGAAAAAGAGAAQNLSTATQGRPSNNSSSHSHRTTPPPSGAQASSSSSSKK